MTFEPGTKVNVAPLCDEHPDGSCDDGFRNIGVVVEPHIDGLCTIVRDEEDGELYDVLDRCITVRL